MENQASNTKEKTPTVSPEKPTHSATTAQANTPPRQEKKAQKTAKGIAGGIMLTLGVLTIVTMLIITFYFFKGEIEIIATFFSVTALLILTSIFMFFGNIILTLNEKEKDAIKQ